MIIGREVPDVKAKPTEWQGYVAAFALITGTISSIAAIIALLKVREETKNLALERELLVMELRMKQGGGYY